MSTLNFYNLEATGALQGQERSCELGYSQFTRSRLTMSNSTTTYSQAYLNQYRGYVLTDVAIAFLVLDVVFVALRFYSRYLQKRALKVDDYLMIPALLFCIGIIIIAFIVVDDGGVGRHVQYTAQHYDKFRLWYQTYMIAVAVLYMFAAALPKLAILSLYLQIFVNKISIWGTYATIAAIIINVIVMVPILVAKCSPISYGWKSLLDSNLEGGWCANVEPRLQYASLANIVTDISMLLLPLPTLHKLKTSRGAKLGLALTFGMAAIGLATSCLRFAAFFKTEAYEDETWASVELVAWCIVEPGIYVFVASQMAFRPLTMAFVHTSFGTKLTHIISSPFGRNTASRKKSTWKYEGERSSPTQPEHTVNQSMHETTIQVDPDHLPSAPPSVYNGNIWISHEFQVENQSTAGSLRV